MLRAAYDDLLAEVDRGGFHPPSDGGLTAEQIVAHLVANDELLIEATEAAIAGSTWAYYDAETVHRPQLDAMTTEYGGLDGLTTLLRATSRKLCALAERLGTGEETLVDTHIHEGFDLNIDELLPWGRTLDIHGRIHLPGHTGQLRGLRDAA
jgi:hypothetical protein